MSGSLSVVVVGGGIGGLTAALALSRAGHDVRVVEQAAGATEVGAGIQLAPNATRVLRELGVLEAIERVAVRPEAFEFRRWDDGRLLSSTPLGASIERTYGAPYLHVHRADLVRVLADALPAGRVETGRRCAGVAQRPGGAWLGFTDGSGADVDLVVGADGIHSAVRESLFGPRAARFTGHAAYRGLVPAERVAGLGPGRRATVNVGPGAHLVHYYVAGGRLLNVVCVVEEGSWTRESWTDTGDPRQLRAAFAGWHPTVRAVIEALDRPLKWAVFDRDPLPRWGAGAVTLLGDACHPMPPYAAQGAGQAIEDAAALAGCLDGAADVPGALVRYAELRRPRTARVQAMSRDNGTRFHLPDGPDQLARDEAMASSFGISPDVDWLYGQPTTISSGGRERARHG
ncbi:FAD-dependent monooxygenase [Pseudonocardia lacus]|uniref:FAD-dependent monooxygenase n=1 Tax=Pseudonocardia lacus TaxID=2835865 RepID=UPI00202793D0|nr:FAD-dependent monooxygenase [Pseudonocardia lacus]